MSRREFGRWAAGAAASLALPVALGGARPPNILMLVADDLGPMYLGCYGDRAARTPHIDALAAAGVRFTRAYCTQASCSPSRASIFSGLSPHRSGQLGLAHVGYHMDAALPTFPQLLSAAGYRTGFIGKIHVDGVEAHFESQGRGEAMTLDVARTEAAARAFFDVPDPRPFLLFLGFTDPHAQREGDRWAYLDTFKGSPARPRGPEALRPFPLLISDTPAHRREAAGYYNSVERLDEGVGRILEALAASGRGEDTLVLFLSDHGASSPFPRGKETCLERGLGVPLIARGPGIQPAGAAREELISLVDLFPTLLDVSGIPPESLELEGASLKPLLAGGAPVAWRRYLCGELNAHQPQDWDPARSIRDDRYKLIKHLLSESEAARAEFWPRWADRPPFELYDLQEDPEETTNLYPLGAPAQVLARLTAALTDWQRATGDPLLDEAELLRLSRQHLAAVVTGDGRMWERPADGW